MSSEEDFGFSLIDESELNKSDDKLEQVLKLIMPLLNNLAKDDKKEIIKWPDRAKKVTALINKINKIIAS